METSLTKIRRIGKRREREPLRLAVLDNAQAIWNAPGVDRLFHRLIDLKLTGYRGKYPDGALPVDTTEFIGTHYLLGYDRPEGFHPIMGFRSIPLATTDRFFQTFPALAIAQRGGSPAVFRAVEEVVDRARARGVRLIYNGGWTIAPEVRADAELWASCKDRMMGLDYLAHHGSPDAPAEVVGIGVVHLKTDLYFRNYGYDWMTGPDGELPTIRSAYLGGVEVRMLHVTAYRENARRAAEEIVGLWDARRIWSPDPLPAAPSASANALPSKRAA